MKTKFCMVFAGVCFASLFLFEGNLSAAPAGKTVKKKVKKVTVQEVGNDRRNRQERFHYGGDGKS